METRRDKAGKLLGFQWWRDTFTWRCTLAFAVVWCVLTHLLHVCAYAGSQIVGPKPDGWLDVNLRRAWATIVKYAQEESDGLHKAEVRG